MLAVLSSLKWLLMKSFRFNTKVVLTDALSDPNGFKWQPKEAFVKYVTTVLSHWWLMSADEKYTVDLNKLWYWYVWIFMSYFSSPLCLGSWVVSKVEWFYSSPDVGLLNLDRNLYNLYSATVRLRAQSTCLIKEPWACLKIFIGSQIVRDQETR